MAQESLDSLTKPLVRTCGDKLSRLIAIPNSQLILWKVHPGPHRCGTALSPGLSHEAGAPRGRSKERLDQRGGFAAAQPLAFENSGGDG